MSGSTIGGIDSSIPLRAGQGVQQNGLAVQNPGQFVNTLGAINQLKLFPLRQQQMELGIDQQKLAIAGQQLQQGLTKLNAGVGYMLPLLVNKDGTPTTGVSAKDITTALADASHPDSGVLSPSQAAGLLQTLPNGGSDPAANRAWLLRNYAQVRAAAGAHEQALQMIGMSPATRDTGQEIQSGGVAGPLTAQPGGFTPQTGTQVFPSRAQGAAQVSWTKNDGTQVQGTLADFWKATGNGETMGPAFNQDGSQAAPAGSTGPAPGGAAQRGGMGGVTGINGPVTPQNPPRLQQQAQAPGPVEGPMPGTPEYLREAATNFGVASQRAANFASDMFPLNQAREALEKAPTGKGSEAAHNVSSYLNTFAPNVLQKALSFVSPVMTSEEVAAYDEAKKYLTQGQLGAPGATRSNEGLTTAGAASPSTVISKEAAQIVLRGMIALRRMEQNAVLEFQNKGLEPGKWYNFQSRFATDADPRVYSFDLLTPQQRSKIVQGLKGPAQTKFWDQVYSAQQNGVIGQPSANGQ